MERGKERHLHLVGSQPSVSAEERYCELKDRWIEDENRSITLFEAEMSRLQGLGPDAIQRLENTFFTRLRKTISFYDERRRAGECRAIVELVSTEVGCRVVAQCTAIDCPQAESR